MAYVKNYNPGQIRLDLPTANYIYELPLLSFEDLRGGLGVSLIFNYEERLNGENPSLIQSGYMLNIQKRVVMREDKQSGYVQDGNGKTVGFTKVENTNYYLFGDDSLRILTLLENNGGYILEYPDNSKEEYNQHGKITSAFDISGNKVLEYTYITEEKLSQFTYRGNKTVSISYNTSGAISSVEYSSYTITFTYATDNNNNSSITVEFPSGDVVVLEANGYNFTAKAGEYNENNTVVEYRNATEITTIDTESVKISSIVHNGITPEVIDSSTYKFSSSIDANVLYDHVEVTDFYGVKNRIQYSGKDPQYAYELLHDDAFPSSQNSIERFQANVKMLSPYSPSKDLHVIGTQTIEDGISISVLDDFSEEIKMYVKDGSLQEGHYVLSGWMRVNSFEYQSVESVEIKVIDFVDPWVENPTINPTYIFEINCEPYYKWKYFSCAIYASGIKIAIGLNEFSNYIDFKDLRITYQEPVTGDSGNSHLAIQEDGFVLNYNTQTFLPLRDCDFKCNGIFLSEFYSNEEYADVAHFEDLLVNKLNYKRGKHQNKFFFNKVTDFMDKNEDEEVMVKIGNVSYALSLCYLAKRSYVKGHGYVTTFIVDDRSDAFLIYRTVDNVGNILSEKALDDKQNVIYETSDGITVTYTRDNEGKILSESAKNSSGDVLYTRHTSYSTDAADNSPLVTKTDEFGKITVQKLNSVWGTLISTTLPDGTVISNSYDSGMNALTSKTVTKQSDSRSNTFGYTNGNLSSVQSDGFVYGFNYNSGKLASVTKQNAAIEEYTYTTNTESTFLPSTQNAHYIVTTNLDKYRRVSSVDGHIANTYNFDSDFNDSGSLVTAIDHSDALLVMSTDMIAGKTARYTYDSSNRLIGESVRDSNTYSNIRTNESFSYDDANRLYLRTFTYYDTTGSKSIESEIEYKKSATSAIRDNTVSGYTYIFNNSTASFSANTFDSFNRVNKKTVTLGGASFSKNFTFDKTRITGVADKYANTQNIGAFGYTYDSLGRIASQTYSAGTSKTVSYVYDSFSRLIRENNGILSKTFVYTYDTIGNITGVQEYAYTTGALPASASSTKSFTYDTTVRDRLISYNGEDISYNSYGYVSNYEGKNYSWSRGKLQSISRGNPRLTMGDYEYCGFTYNAYGQRTKKMYVFDSLTEAWGSPNPTYNTEYFYDNSGRLMRELCTETYKGSTTIHTHHLIYLYDETGVIGVMYAYDSAALQPYYYHRNLQGDVLAILNTSGTKVAEYAYDAYGNCTVKSYTDYNLAYYNPIRYRGYYYDRETKLYYLNSRYYNSEWRRFISNDNAEYLEPGSINGLNLYCYCMNNPIMYSDPSGNSPTGWWEWALAGVSVAGLIVGSIFTCGTLAGAVLAGAAIGAGISLGTQALSGEFNLGQFVLDTGVGAITGLIGGSGVSQSVATRLGGVIGAGSNFASQLITGTKFKDISVMQILVAGAIGAISGFIGGAGARNKAAINQGKGVQSAIQQLNKVVRRIANGYRYNATTAQVAFTNAMNGLTGAISSQMSRMFATAMVSYGVSTLVFTGMDARFDHLGWWFF